MLASGLVGPRHVVGKPGGVRIKEHTGRYGGKRRKGQACVVGDGAQEDELDSAVLCAGGQGLGVGGCENIAALIFAEPESGVLGLVGDASSEVALEGGKDHFAQGDDEATIGDIVAR